MSTNDTPDKTCPDRKRVKSLFIAQRVRPSDLADLNLRALTPFQRVLLVADGTVTQLIEAYTLAPVEVAPISQETYISPNNHAWLKTTRGTTLIERQVLLKRAGGRRLILHAYATSLIVRDRLPQEIQEGLEIDGEGLGRLLRRSGSETIPTFGGSV